MADGLPALPLPGDSTESEVLEETRAIEIPVNNEQHQQRLAELHRRFQEAQSSTACDPPPIPSQGTFPDSFEAASATTAEDGAIVGSGGVRLRIVSLFVEGALVCTADSGEYNPETGYASLAGSVRVQIEGTQLALHCRQMDLDPMLGRASIQGLDLGLPFSDFVPAERMPKDKVRAGLNSHFYSATPDTAYLQAGSVLIEKSSSRSEFVLHQVRITHSPQPEPDLFVTCGEVRMTGGERVVFKDISLVVSGVNVFSWPRLSRSLKKEHRPYGFGIPQVRFDRQVGLAWRQPFHLDARSVMADGLLDYSPEYGLRARVFAYVEPVNGARLGVASGESSLVDAQLRDVRRHDNATVVYEQQLQSPFTGVDRAQLSAEYGEISSVTDPLPGDVQVAIRARDTRFAAQAKVEFTPVPLGESIYFAGTGRAALFNYEDSDKDYEILGGSAGLILHEPGFNHYLLYTRNNTSGEPVFSFDEVRKQEIDFATSLRLLPDWRNVLRGIYDMDKDEFNRLEVGAMKRQRSYEVGMYWDFARESAGVELGLLFD